jgi:hypothetical protein
MQTSIDDRLRSLPAELEPLKLVARRYLADRPRLSADGTLQIGPAPWSGSEAFSIILYPPAARAWLTAFERRVGPIPGRYAAVLQALNGCFAFSLSLYGLPPSLQSEPPLLDRRVLQPHDLEAANTRWARDYLGANGEFHFGGRSWSDVENVGYFVDPNDAFRSRLTGGEVVQQWGSLRALLAEELLAAEAFDVARRPATA